MKIWLYLVAALAFVASCWLWKDYPRGTGQVVAILLSMPGIIGALLLPYALGLILIRKIRKQPGKVEA